MDEIKERKRQQKQVNPTAILSQPLEGIKEEMNVGRKEEKIERKRVSFDLRVDLHKKLKMESLIQEKNIYILIEEALEEYLAK